MNRVAKGPHLRRGLVLAIAPILIAVGCSNKHEPTTTTKTHMPSASSRVMKRGPGHAVVRGVAIDWRRLASGVVCYGATRPGRPRRTGLGTLSACVRHLHADEIAFVMKPLGTGQLMIAGLRGPRVKRVYLRLSSRAPWDPPNHAGVFFGYVPTGTVVGVVKVLDDGTQGTFVVHVQSRQ